MKVHNLVSPFVAHYDEHGPLVEFVTVLDQGSNARIYLFPHDCKSGVFLKYPLKLFGHYFLLLEQCGKLRLAYYLGNCAKDLRKSNF